MKKLTLSENLFSKKRTKLTEAFSDTMPNWLRANILSSMIDNRPGNQYSASRRQKEYKKYGKTYDIDALKGKEQAGNSLRGNINKGDEIWYGFKDNDIDFTRATFIPGPPPVKSTDPRLKPPNQPFILIEYQGKKQVYAPGFNDKELAIFPVSDKYAPRNTLKYARFSDYKDYITDFCYVNTADPENKITDLKNTRKTNRAELNSLKRQGFERTNSRDVMYNDKVDKSGYIINPNRYQDALRQAQKLNYAKKMQDTYNKLQAIKDTIVNYLVEADAADRNSIKFASQVLRNELADAINYYNMAAAEIQGAERQWDPTSTEFKKWLDMEFSPYNIIWYMDDRVNRAENAVSTITFVDFPW